MPVPRSFAWAATSPEPLYSWTAGRTSPCSLCSGELATFDASDYDQKDSKGFINLWGLPDTVQALRAQGKLGK